MSGSFNSFNSNIPQTSLDSAYQFSTFSSFINNNINPTSQNTINQTYSTKFSPICIFCSSKDSNPLSRDGGSLRQCNNCKKQFKAVIIK
jgi:hypothetical protein